ncbi:MAG: ABC transporter [Anaerolineaceae bacterium]|nr:ABC transporter [Anaerolineaceae bacterium]
MNAAITLWNKQMSKLSGEETFGLLIQPILWVVLFGVGMKGVMGSAVPGGDDFYIAFMAPGIVALSALGGAIAGGSVWLDERMRGIVKEYLVAPIPRLSILLGNTFTIVTKSLFQAIVIFVIGVLMGAQIANNPPGWVGGILLVAGYSIGFAGIALALASKTNDPGAYHAVIFLLNLPLLFLSNALYPLSSLPQWMQIGARINPTSYVVDGLRQLVLTNGNGLASGELLPLWQCAVAIILFATLGMWLAYVAFRSAIR